jgi:hypothetical protein
MSIPDAWCHTARQAYAEDNTAAHNGQEEDLDRLSMSAVPSLDPLVAETVRLLDRSIRRATAAQADSNAVPTR